MTVMLFYDTNNLMFKFHELKNLFDCFLKIHKTFAGLKNMLSLLMNLRTIYVGERLQEGGILGFNP